MAYNKIIYDGETLIDLTGDTASADKVLSPYTFHDKTGAQKTGTCTFDSDTSSATATPDEILFGKTAYAKGRLIAGSMPNNGSVTKKISSKNEVIVIPPGNHDGSGSVAIDAVEKAKIIPQNIAEGIEILGVIGTHSSGTQEVKQQKTVTPESVDRTYVPDAGYTCFSQFTVKAIPYAEAQNSAGGITVTIG